MKYKADRSIERCRARLVAKGYTQTFAIDNQETYAPVAKMSSVCVLLSLVVIFYWPLQQLDMKNAFLNSELEEEVYINLPPVFEGTLGSDKVCKIKRSLYELKQSTRA